MKSCLRLREPARPARRGFTLVEVLAAPLLMAIIIPVTMQGMSIASRAGILGQRKVAALRVAERMLNESIVTSQISPTSDSGVTVDGEVSYPWTLESEPWASDAMTQLTVRVTFSLQGSSYTVSASTLVNPAPSSEGTEPVEAPL